MCRLTIILVESFSERFLLIRAHRFMQVPYEAVRELLEMMAGLAPIW